MKIQYLGTAAAEGIPALFCQCSVCQKAERLGGRNIRGRSGAIINDHILLDFPPDIFFHKIRFHLNLALIDTLVVTHSHADHFDGAELMLRSERCFCHLNEMSGKKLHIYGNEAVQSALAYSHNFEFRKAQSDFFDYTVVEPYQTFSIGELQFFALPARHDPKETCLIYGITEIPSGKRVLYFNDTALLDEKDLLPFQGFQADAASLDCTHMFDKRPHDSHMGLDEACILKETLLRCAAIKPDARLILTHFSHNGGAVYDDLAPYARDLGFDTAYDGMEVSL